MGRRLWRPMSTVLPRGLKTGRWHQRASHASWLWPPNTFANGIRPEMGQLDGCETVRAKRRNSAQAATPAPQYGTVPPRQVPHAERRPREYLMPKERSAG